MLTSTLINVIAQQPSSWTPEESLQWNRDLEFDPESNLSYVNTTESSMIQLPANHTLVSGDLEISPIWQSTDSGTTIFDSNDGNMAGGAYVQTEKSSIDNNLRLMRNSSIIQITDFETTGVVPSDGWFGNGLNDEVWTIVPPSTNPIVSQSGMNLPSQGFDGSGFLSTSGIGDLDGYMHSCLRSPSFDMPRVINNYSVSFDQWLALDSSDTAWIEVLDMNGDWASLTPNVFWSGQTNSWNRVELSLDSFVSSVQSTLNIQLCFETSNLDLPRGGWFIDELSVYNEGEELGSWLHGNLTGDYQPNSNSKFIIPLNFTSIPNVDEIEISMNWDIQGYIYDYITVEYSIDNGTSWNSISNSYGIPGIGVLYNGNLYYGESNGWIPIYLPLNYNFTNSPALNNTLLRFSGYTDSSINFGGKVSSGWEGIAIDNIVLHSGRQSTNPTSILYNNFSGTPNIQLGSEDGWLVTLGSTSNQWQWTDTIGLNSQESTNYSFDYGQNLPSGWGILSIDDNEWEVGVTSNSTGYGPGFWPSGQHGAGISLNTVYQSQMLTHLYSPEYIIPDGASSRLSFKSWVCTESNWDGGAISASTDGGLNWWYLPPTIGTFHDQISTINSNSPFFGEGIFDGSTVIGGCQNTIRQFDDKVFETSNLSGNNIKFRFSFFSDQLLEFDGWYIDDAGLEIDIFETEGSWVSPLLSPDPLFGWGSLDGFVNQPQNTIIRFDILDLNNNSIEGYSNRTLPLDIQLNPSTHPNLRIRANLSTLDKLISPTIEYLAIGYSTYFDAYHFNNININSGYSGSFSSLNLNYDGQIVANQVSYLRIQTPSFCPQIGAQMSSIGDNISLFSSQFNLVSTYYETSNSNSRLMNFSNDGEVSSSLSDTLQLTWMAGQKLDKFLYRPICAESPQSPVIELGIENQSIFSWPTDSSDDKFGISTKFTSIASQTTSNLADIYGSVEINLTDGQQVELSHRILYPSNSLPNSVGQYLQFPASFLIELSSQQIGNSLNDSSTNGAIISTTGQDSTVQTRFNSQQTCPNLTFPEGMINSHYGVALCSFEFIAHGDIAVSFSNLQAISPVQNVQLSLGHEMLKEIRNQSYMGDDRAILDIPMHVSTSSGSIQVNLTTTSYLHQIDKINSISQDRWLPEQTIIVNSSHVRFDPLLMSEQNHQLDNIKLVISSSANFDDSLIEVEIINLYSSKDFIITKGADLAILEIQQSSVDCLAGLCQVEWSLTSNWQLDDIDDIHWMVISEDSSGLQTGPDLLVRETGFNEVENDLEIIQFSAFGGQNALHDWTDANWPFNLQSNESIIVNGQVRFQGVSNSFIQANQASIEVKLEAIPPKNISGGPDTWISDPVEWSQTWYVEAESNGLFTATISTPSIGIIPSNTSLEISVHINRRGNPEFQSNNSMDMTAAYQKTRILFDIDSPELISLSVLDPGGVTTADGHIWMSGQDIPLRAVILDTEGLSPSITVWSWSEYKDDTNEDGIMDIDEYVSSTLALNTGSKTAIIDLPILSWYDIRGPFESGRLSIVIGTEDLAGNPLIGGGNFGESTDLATITVENQYPTYFDFDSLELDLVDQQILPGRQHTLAFSITDGNGIDSIDQFQLALLGRDLAESCNIHYSPRFSVTNFDENCFELEPIIDIIGQDGLLSWDIRIKFRLSWDAAQSLAVGGGIPSLKIIDEGQDLYLGISLLSMLEWTPNNSIQLSTLEITDNNLPKGQHIDQQIWVQSNDSVEIKLHMMYLNTTYAVEYLPNSFQVLGKFNNQSSNILMNYSIGFDGIIDVSFIVDSSAVTDNKLFLEIILLSPEMEELSSQTYQVFIDDSAPMLSLTLKDLLQIDSNRLFEIPVMATISDDFPLIQAELFVNWYFTDNGSIIQGTSGQKVLLSSGTSQFSTYFNDTLDITPINQSLISRDNGITIWLESYDNSGLPLFGFGTISQPLLPRFNWVDFDPKLDIVSIETDNPVYGEKIELLTRIVNVGQLNGSLQVDLVDGDGQILETKLISIEAGSWVETTWYFEAWKTGGIELFVNLTNFSQSKSISILDVEGFKSSQQEVNGLMGFIALLVFLFVGGFGFAYYRRSKELEQYTKLHIEQIVEKRRSAPPRPSELDDISQEE